MIFGRWWTAWSLGTISSVGTEPALGHRSDYSCDLVVLRSASATTLRPNVLYFHHASSLEHDPSVLAPEHPDTPARIEAIEAKLDAAGWPGCERRSGAGGASSAS